MRKIAVPGMLALAAFMLAGCATQVRTYPLATAETAPPGSLPVYFGQQEHPPVRTRLRAVSYSVRIARQTSNQEQACHLALEEAVEKLRTAALDKHANAVIDVWTRFHDTQTGSTTEFTCGVSPTAASLAVTGELVVLESP